MTTDKNSTGTTSEDEVYMKQPDGFITPGQDRATAWCELIDGLKQSRCWNTFWTAIDSKSDPCSNNYVALEGELFIVAVYADYCKERQMMAMQEGPGQTISNEAS